MCSFGLFYSAAKDQSWQQRLEEGRVRRTVNEEHNISLYAAETTTTHFEHNTNSRSCAHKYGKVHTDGGTDTRANKHTFSHVYVLNWLDWLTLHLLVWLSYVHTYNYIHTSYFVLHTTAQLHIFRERERKKQHINAHSLRKANLCKREHIQRRVHSRVFYVFHKLARKWSEASTRSFSAIRHWFTRASGSSENRSAT